MKKKTLALILALVMVFGAAVGGTIAWLTDKTAEVKNTFTVGNINITLDETLPEGKTAKMVPGNEIDKDPKVTVKANSEACWLFVKIDESSNLKNFISYTVDSGWTKLQDGVYYREVGATTTDVIYPVLTDNKVAVLTTVDKTAMDGLTEATYPTLTFKAYAIQKDGFATAAAAWTEASK